MRRAHEWSDDDDYAHQGRTKLESQAKLDALEEEPDEIDEDYAEDQETDPPAKALFDNLDQPSHDTDERDELIDELYWQRYKRYDEFLGSIAWKEKRAHVINEAEGRCQGCYVNGRREPATQVHHIRYVEPLEEQLRDDLVALCRRCHVAIHEDMRKWPAEPGTRETSLIADLLAESRPSGDDD